MIKKKIVIGAAQLSGGAVAGFEGRERFSTKPDDGRQNVSSGRMCIKLADHAITGEFDLETAPAEGPAVFRIRGMWDMYRDLSERMINSTALMDTAGIFEVALNGSVLYNGKITFWNYRRWRFWPSIDIHFSANLLRSGTNLFAIINHTRAFKELKQGALVPAAYLANTAYQVSDVQILLCDDGLPPPVPVLPADTFLGHMIGGHNVVHLENEDCSHAIDGFKRSRQGNLIVFLMNPGKTNYDVDLDLIDTEAIIRSGLHVALRYYGGNQGATIPEEDYVGKLRSFVKRLGSHFLGFGPHEQHGVMSRVIEANPAATDLSVYGRAYVELFAQRLARIKAISADAPVWDTDPSFYSHFHMRAGASFPAIEVCVQNVSLDMASARGTAKAFGKDRWGAINAFECQAYGGLGMLDQEAASDPLFEQRRRNLWWLTQHQLYLGGARIIYSESGMFDHRVTLQREFDDPHLCDLRASHAALVEFAATCKLQGQPLASIAYLQGRHDLYKGSLFSPAFVEAMGNSLYSWKNLEVCYPGVTRSVPANESLDAYQADKLAMVTDAPYGAADILPVDAGADVMGQYRVLITSGWHTMDAPLLAKLEGFVREGGVLVLLLPHLTTGTSKNNPCACLDPVWLERLCGIRVSGRRESMLPLNAIRLCAGTGPGRFPALRAHLERKQPGCDYSGTVIKSVIPVGVGVAVLAKEEVSGLPFLIENKLGLGSVFLFNLADFPSQEPAYQVINAALADIVAGINVDVCLTQGERISFYLYPVNAGQRKYRLYILNNDWYGASESTSAEFRVFSRRLCLEIPRRQVVVVDVSPTEPGDVQVCR